MADVGDRGGRTRGRYDHADGAFQGSRHAGRRLLLVPGSRLRADSRRRARRIGLRRRFGTDPSYQQVCTGTTGHAEVVQITFDSAALSFGELLNVFFDIHDPTTLNRQGADMGTQYRSVIFFHSPSKSDSLRRKSRRGTLPAFEAHSLVTQVAPIEAFYRAEEYHQGYFRSNPAQGYCQFVVAPKVAKVRTHFAAKLKS